MKIISFKIAKGIFDKSNPKLSLGFFIALCSLVLIYFIQEIKLLILFIFSLFIFFKGAILLAIFIDFLNLHIILYFTKVNFIFLHLFGEKNYISHYLQMFFQNDLFLIHKISLYLISISSNYLAFKPIISYGRLSQIITFLGFVFLIVGVYLSDHTATRFGKIQVSYSIHEDLIDKDVLFDIVEKFEFKKVLSSKTNEKSKSIELHKYSVRLELILDSLIIFNMDTGDNEILNKLRDYLKDSKEEKETDLVNISKFLIKRDALIKKATKKTVETTRTPEIIQIENDYKDKIHDLLIDYNLPDAQ